MGDKQYKTESLLSLTADIVSSHVSNNTIALAELPQLIQQVFASLSEISKSNSAGSSARPKPAVSPKKSVTPDYLICLEDGKKLKMLKRHLMTAYGMTPEAYRARWELPSDYPMVAPNYAQQRRELAREIGLGSARRKGQGKTSGK